MLITSRTSFQFAQCSARFVGGWVVGVTPSPLVPLDPQVRIDPHWFSLNTSKLHCPLWFYQISTTCPMYPEPYFLKLIWVSSWHNDVQVRWLALEGKNRIVIFHGISNESCKPLHLNCEIKHNLNVMVRSIDLKYYQISQFNFCCFSSVTFGHYNSR